MAAKILRKVGREFTRRLEPSKGLHDVAMSTEIEGPTPGGGNRAVSYAFDAEGNEVSDMAKARTAEIVEYDGEIELGRTYVTLDPSERLAEIPVASDASATDDSDWIKHGTWDLYEYRAGQMVLVTTLTQLLEVLGWSGLPPRERRDHIANLMTLPSWTPAPADLKTEVAAWLASVR